MARDLAIPRELLLRMLDGETIQLSLELESEVREARMFAADNPEWQPLRRLEADRLASIQYAHVMAKQPPPTELWANDLYEVFVYPMGADGDDAEVDKEEGDWRDGGLHLSLKRYDRAAVHNWRHFQQIKNEIAGEFREAVELYPGEHRIADNANQYHLWVLPTGMEVPLGWKAGMVTLDHDDVWRYNRNGDNGRQEPLQPGLTMGQGMNDHQKKAITTEAEQTRQAVLGGALASRPNRAARRKKR